MTREFLAPLIATAVFALSAAAHADVVDLTTVATYGDVTTTSSTAALSTAAVDSGELPVSGTSALFYWTVDGQGLEQLLLPSGGTLGADTFEGSALSYTFTLSNPGTVSFNWALSTLETDPAYLDRAFLSFDESVSTLATATFAPQSGSYVSSLLGAGSHVFAVGVLDVNDVAGISTLSVSNLAVNAAAVPEPETYALLMLGLGVVAARLRRNQV